MPFKIKTNVFKQITIKYLINKYPTLKEYVENLKTGNKNFSWNGLQILLDQLNVSIPLYHFFPTIDDISPTEIFEYRKEESSRIYKVENNDKEDITDNQGDRKKVKDYKFDRQNLKFSIKTDLLKTKLKKLEDEGHNYLYIKFAVADIKKGKNNKHQENFEIFFGGLKGDKLDSNGDDFIDINGKIKPKNYQGFKNFKEKNQILNKNGHFEFCECNDMGGLLHELSTSISWISEITSTEINIEPMCQKNPPSGYLAYDPNCSCNNQTNDKYMTTIIFSGEKNTKSWNIFQLIFDFFFSTTAYGDRGTGCCP